MNRFEVVGRFVQINTGVVQLDDKQAARCQHVTRKLKDGTHEVLVPIQFKQGEVFGYNGELPKDIATVRDLDKPTDDPAAPRRKSRVRAVIDAGARALTGAARTGNASDKKADDEDKKADVGAGTNSADPGLDPGREGSGAAQERDPS